MKKKITSLTFLLLLMIGAVMGQGVYQFPNSDFEMWRNGSGNNGPQRPRYWHSFSEATGGYQNLSSTDYHEKVTGHSGYALRIKAHKVWAVLTTVKANGAMSTGRTMMGSSTVSSPQNYNFDPNATDANGDSFQWTFHGKPDSISFWARANANYSSSTEAILKVYIHDENEFKDHADNSETGTWYGRCLMNFVPSSGWTRIARPVEWKSQYSGVTPSLILGSFSTCKNAGQGSGQEELDIDELRCIYDKGLATLSIGGVANSAIKDVFNANEYTTHSGLTGAGTNSGTYTYEYTSSICASDFTENFVQATAKSARVHSLTITQPTVANPNAVITVTHNDNSTFIYTIHFANVINSVVEISTPNTTVCSADGAVLTAATGFDSYSWSNGASGNSTTVYSTGTYTVTASKQGCTATSSIAITVNPSPAVIINGDAEFCAGSNFELTAAGASSYVWSTGSHNATSGNITAAGTYTVMGTGANGCTATATQTVAMKETPNVQINSSSANPCPGDEVTLTATGGVSYVWNTGAQTATATVTPAATTTYTVIATGSNGCTKVESFELAVAAGVVPIQINGPNTVCVGDVVNNITATEGLSGYTWSGVSSEYFYSVNNTAGLAEAPAGTYVIELRATAAGSSCESYTTHTIQVVEPTVTLSSLNDMTICKGSVASLTASATTNCDAVDYAWTGNLTGNTVSVSPTATQTYTVTATVSLPADLHNCTATDTKSVTVNVNAPSVSLNTLNNVALCEGEDLNLTASLNGSANGNVTYAWTVPAGNSSETNTYTLNNITTAATGNYTVMATATQSLNGVTCSATDSKSAQVTVNALPNVTISGSNVLCAGSTTRLTAEGGSSYLWNNGHTTAALQVTTAGTYMVIGTDANGCSNTAETTVTVNTPSVVLNDMADQTICADSEAELAATLNGAATGDVTYAWNGNMTGREVTVSPATTTTYTVTATATIGDCSATDTKEVTVNVIPQVTLAAQNATQTVQYGNAISIITFETNGALSVVGDLPEGLSFDGVNRRITGTPAFVGTQTFNVVATAENECSQEETQISITVENNASIVLDNANQSVCPGNDIINIQIHANNVNVTGVTGLPQGIQYANGVIAGSSQESGTYNYTVQANDVATGASMNASGQIVIKAPGVKEITTSVCTNALPYEWRGTEYEQSGTYDYTIPGVEAVNGCDSIERLVLTVNPSPTATIVVEGMTARIQNPQEGISYEWDNGGEETETVYDAPGEYSVYVYDAHCDANIHFVITSADPAIATDIANPTPICANGALTLTEPLTTNATTTGWQLSENDAFENPIAYTNQTLNETYNGWYLRYVAANGQIAAYSNVVTITVNALPTVAITGNTSFCEGGNTTLTASEGASYAWSNQATTQAITVNEGGRYAVTVTDNNGCSNTAYTSVTVNALPEVTISGASTICAGAETTLTANGAATYEWPGYLDAQTATLLIAQAGIYQVIGTDENGCQNTATLTVVENIPSVTLASMEDIVVCENGTVQLNANLSGSAVGTVTYQWTGPNGFTANGQEATLQSATVAQSGAYTVTASAVNTMNGVSCTSTDSKTVNVTVNALPEVNISGNTSFCEGGNTTLTASEGASYRWSTQATTQEITVTEGGRYIVTVTDNNGCSNTAYTSVTVNALPEVTISGASTICAGAETTLTANGAATYEWPDYPYVQTATLLIAQAGTYQVVGTDENGCQNTASITVVENIPSVTLATMEDIVVCENGTVQLGASLDGTATGTVTYQWTGPNGFTANGQEATLQSATVAQSGAYTVTASAVNTMNGVSCTTTDSKSVNVTVNALPEVSITGNTAICAGATTTLTASEGASYAWSNQATTQAITVNEGGRYAVTVTDNNGCSNAEYVSVEALALPATPVATTVDNSSCAAPNGSIEIISPVGDEYTYSLNGGLSQSSTFFTGLNAGNYTLTVRNANGCVASSTVIVSNEGNNVDAQASANTTCVGGTIQLTGLSNTEGVTYSWSGPQNFTSSTQNPTIANATTEYNGVYTLTVTETATNCTMTASVNVTVNTLPNVAISGENTICAGAQTTLTAHGASTYEWQNAADAQSATLLVDQAGTYSVTGTDANGCQNTATFTIVENTPSVTLASMNDIEVCENSTLQLNAMLSGVANGTVTYQWTGPNNFSVRSQNASILNTEVSRAGEYTVLATATKTLNGVTCTATDSKTVNVIVNSRPEVTISGVTTICPDAETLLRATGASTYQWSTGIFAGALRVSRPGTYTVTGTDAHGCTNSASVEVVVNTPNVTLNAIEGNSTLCEGADLNLTASVNGTPVGNVTYMWNTQNTEASISIDNVTLNHAGTYMVVATATNTLNGVTCEATDTKSIEVTVNALPENLVFDVTNNTSCAAPNGVVVVTAPAGSNYSYKISTASAAQTSPRFEGLNAGVYTIVATNTTTGCQREGEVEVVTTGSNLHATASTLPVCQGETATLTGTSTVSGVTFAWSGPANFSSAAQNPTFANVTVANAGEYTLTVTETATQCTATATTTLVVNVPQAQSLREVACNAYTWNANGETYTTSGTYFFAHEDNHGCTQVDTLHLTINNPVHVAYTEVACDSYEWNGTTYTQSGNYLYAHEDANGCEQVDTLHLTIHNTPVVTISGNTNIVEGNSTTLTATGADTYVWNTDETTAAITVTPETTTTYTVVGTSNNCTAEPVSVVVNVSECVIATKTIVAEACGSYTWYGVEYTESTTTATHTVAGVAADGCDSVYTLNLTIWTSDATEFSKTACGSYTWENDIYTESNDYVKTYTNIHGCDSVVTLHLTINNPVHVAITEVACDSYEWNGTVYTQSGNYLYAHSDANGCEQVDTLHLTIHNTPVVTISGNTNIVEGNSTTLTATGADTYVWNTDESTAAITVSPMQTTTYTVVGTSNNCSSNPAEVTVTVSECEIATKTIVAEACGSYTWYGVEYTESTTTATHTVAGVAADGCDSVYTLNLTIWTPDATEFSKTACGSYTWENDIYTESNDYVKTYTNIHGCDSVVTLRLTINNPVHTAVTEVACGNYEWNGNNYTESGSYFFAHEDANGCVQVDTLYLTINNPVHTAVTEVACGNYEWNGTVYTQSGNYLFAHEDANGCEQVDTLHLTINNPVHNAVTEVACGNYEWNGSVYTQSGNYLFAHEDANGCEQVDTLHLTINNPVHTAATEVACGNYEWNGNNYTESGSYLFAYEDANGCEQVDTLHLTINNPVHTAVTEVACGSYEWNGTVYTQSGNYLFAHEDANGCEQVDTLHLTINNPVHVAVTEVACGDYEWNGTIYTQSGNYLFAHEDANGCEQVDTLHLTINNPVHTAVTEVACGNYEWNGNNYTESGSYLFAHEDANGCEQVDTLHLTINNPAHVAVTEVACGNYEWNGTVYTQSGNYLFAHEDANGCEQVDTLHLTINNPVHTAVTEVACGNYEWNGTVYTQSGNYLFAHEDANGCEQVDTLHLTILDAYNTEFTEVACGSYTWDFGVAAINRPSGSITYTESGDYTETFVTALGCDSVVTLHLTINNPVHESETVVACSVYEWNGTDYDESGDYLFAHEDANGCTQVDTLHLTINQPASKTIYATICNGASYEADGFNAHTAGEHNLYLTAANGCDSIVTLILTVDNNCTFDCGDRMYDVDHNGYNTKAYNGLCWMTENLRSTHYADGSAIPVAMIYNGINANNDTVANLSTYGRLYDWNSTVRGGDAVMTLADEPTAIQGVCPQGWRLPTKQEYEDLVNIYSQYALRSANYWIMNAGSNATGFDLRPAGLYNGFNARCENMGGEAYFYTSTVEGGQPVHLKAMCGCWELIFNNATPANAFSVRCVK